MPIPYIGEIRYFAFDQSFRLPNGWHVCDGTPIDISQNGALFTLIGTQYGGDGVKTFCLPDLRGRAIVGAQMSGAPVTPSYTPGNSGGATAVTLHIDSMAAHNHGMMVTTSPGNATGVNNVIYAQVANPSPQNLYSQWLDGAITTPIDPASLTQTGGSGAHENMQPSLVLYPCIATQGAYPQRP